MRMKISSTKWTQWLWAVSKERSVGSVLVSIDIIEIGTFRVKGTFSLVLSPAARGTQWCWSSWPSCKRSSFCRSSLRNISILQLIGKRQQRGIC
jgi:hypothetical protein